MPRALNTAASSPFREKAGIHKFFIHLQLFILEIIFIQ